MNMAFRAYMTNQRFNNNTPAADGRLWLVSFIEPEMNFFSRRNRSLFTPSVIYLLMVLCRKNRHYNMYVLVAKIKIEE